MKNKFLSIIFLSMLLVLGAGIGFEQANAQVTTLPPGCTSTIGSSTTTGQPCSGTGTVTTSFMVGCNSTMGFSTATGLPCNGTFTATTTFPAGCTSIFGFSTATGLPCNGGLTATTAMFPGCTSILGASTVTGLPCSGGPVPLSFLAGCDSVFGFSTVNGLPCNGTAFASLNGTGTGGGVPGLPSTGVGGNAADNWALIIGSGLISLFGIAYIIRRMRIVKYA